MKEILKKIIPSKKEEKELKKKVDDIIKSIKIKDADIFLGGSIAKGTWLKGEYDIDIFVRFDYKKYKEKSNKLSDIVEEAIKKKFKNYQRLHGSRDYFQIKKGVLNFEIIPILNIKKAEDAKNITDISPLHVEWVKKNKKYCNEIRLTKALCKAKRVYGAESYIKGFSGYVCEILTIHYKSFENLMKAAKKWKKKEVIDTKKFYKNKNEILFILNKSKIHSPLILIDPVQKERNAAAALGLKCFEKFISIAKKLSNKDFIKTKYDEKHLKKKAGKDILFMIDVIPLEGKRDIIGAKLLKAFNFMKSDIRKRGFNIIESNMELEKEALFYIIIKKEKREMTKIIHGPPIDKKEHVKVFKKKYKDVKTKDKRLYAVIKRKYLNPKDLIKDLIKEKYVKERVKKISLR